MVEQILAAIRRGKEIVAKSQGSGRKIIRRAFVKELTGEHGDVARVVLRGHPFARAVEVCKEAPRLFTVIVRPHSPIQPDVFVNEKLYAALREKGYTAVPLNNFNSLNIQKDGKAVGAINAGKTGYLYFSEDHAEPLLRLLIADLKLFPGRFLRVV